jgi:hypothetical protein
MQILGYMQWFLSSALSVGPSGGDATDTEVHLRRPFTLIANLQK